MFASRFNKLALAAALALGGVSAANATVSLSFTDGLNTVICTSAGVCSGAGAAAFSVVSSMQSATDAKIEIKATNWFGWNLGGTLGGSSATASYGALEAILNIDNFSVNRVGPGTGVLQLNGIGFDYTMPAGELKTSIGSASMIRQSGPSLTAGTDLFTRFYADDANAVGGPVLADLLDSCTATGALNNRSCGIEKNWSDVGLGSFSMRIAQQLTVEEGYTVKTQGSLTTVAGVPEPMTLSLVGAALVGAAVAARRRSTKA